VTKPRICTTIALLTLTLSSGALAQAPVGDFYFFDRSEGGVQRVSITTLADENPVTGAGGLTWSCEAGEAKLIVSSTYLGRSMRARVRWAFDDDEFGETESWILRRTGMAVIAPTEVVPEFTRRALQARRVVVQATDYQYRRYSYTFHLEGLPEALEMLPCDYRGGG
jgi:hypothetical protein